MSIEGAKANAWGLTYQNRAVSDSIKEGLTSKKTPGKKEGLNEEQRMFAYKALEQSLEQIQGNLA